MTRMIFSLEIYVYDSEKKQKRESLQLQDIVKIPQFTDFHCTAIFMICLF